MQKISQIWQHDGKKGNSIRFGHYSNFSISNLFRASDFVLRILVAAMPRQVNSFLPLNLPTFPRRQTGSVWLILGSVWLTPGALWRHFGNVWRHFASPLPHEKHKKIAFLKGNTTKFPSNSRLTKNIGFWRLKIGDLSGFAEKAIFQGCVSRFDGGGPGFRASGRRRHAQFRAERTEARDDRGAGL